MMNKILVLWATPRSTSTPFEWMMRMRGDMTCFHEPFGEPWMYGEHPKWPRWDATSPRIPGLTFDSVWMKMQSAATTGPVFAKDFPHFSQHLWTSQFLSYFTHSFLIRHPNKVLPSILSRWPTFDLEETGFVAQRLLFDRLCDRNDKMPPILDSDDLLNDPYEMMKIYCNSVSISFRPDTLHWEPGPRSEVSWYDGGSWHENLANSNGLKIQPRDYIDISQAPDWVKRMYDIILPHYEYLHAHRLRSADPSEK